MQAKTLRNNFLYILVSLVISFFIWLNLSGQNTRTEEITIPLELLNLPQDIVIKSDIPPSVSIQVQANPAQLRFLATKKPDLKVDVSKAHPGQNIFPINNEILNLPHGVSIRRMQPSTVEFIAEQTVTKLLKIEANIVGSPAAGYIIKAVALEPDTVVVKGPLDELSPLNNILTQPIDIEGRKDNLNTVISPYVNGKISSFIFSPPSIKVLVRIEERLMEKSFEKIPIVISNANDFEKKFIFKVDPPTAKVKVSWPQSMEKSITKNDIEASINIKIKDLSEGSQVRLESPVVVTIPGPAAVRSIDPVMVTVTAMPVTQSH